MPRVSTYRAAGGRVKPVRPGLQKFSARTPARVRKASKTKRLFKELSAAQRILTQRILTGNEDGRDHGHSDPPTATKAHFMDIIRHQTSAIEAHLPPGTVSIHVLDGISQSRLDSLFDVTKELMGRAGTEVMGARDVSSALAAMAGLERQCSELRDSKAKGSVVVPRDS